MRTRTAHTVELLVALAVLTAGTGALAGCGSERADGRGTQVRGTDQAARTQSRAREVAEAWDGSEAAAAWAEGYFPMQEPVRLPENAFRNDADKRAYGMGSFVLRGELPATPRKDGQVRWESGESLTLPMMGAREALASLSRGGDGGPHLTVTGAKPGTMTLATSRGRATVPAWLFTLAGYDTPLQRVALNPSKLPRPPIEPVGEVPTDELAPLGRLVAVAPDGRSVVVVANHGSCDKGPAVDVLETDGSVVLSASVVGTEPGPCRKALPAKEMTVELDRPVGDRVLLDAFTGGPVPQGEGESMPTD
ncbi:hypothetical protein [Streptomyces sp. NPDC002133]|uniref:hypothetical protein n=1 Tax=Streptomyces sp. NPDC002133 TaxID=3154409 RepID=UPI0033226707